MRYNNTHEVLYFAADPQISYRILAVLKTGHSKKEVPVYKVEKTTRTVTNYVKGEKVTKEVKASIHKKTGTVLHEIEKFTVVCGSNGKEGTWYNTLQGVRDQRMGISVGEKLDTKKFLELFPKQCPEFQRMFKSEYEKLKKS